MCVSLKLCKNHSLPTLLVAPFLFDYILYILVPLRLCPTFISVLFSVKMPARKTKTTTDVVNCRCGITIEDGYPMVQCIKCAAWEHISCTFSSPDAAAKSAFLCHQCKCDVSTQSDPTIIQPSQTAVSTNTCPCTCAVELSQLRQELLDMKVQMKNQLKILYNSIMALSNAPSLEPAVNNSSPCPNPTVPNTDNKDGSYASAALLTLPVTTDTTPTQMQPSLKDPHPTPPSTPVKEKMPTARSPLKHPRVVTMWGTRKSTTEHEVFQAIRQLGCNNLQIEKRTSKNTPHRRGTWRFVILGEEQDIAYLEDNWKNMPKRWKLQCPASPKSSPDNFQQGFPFPEHLPRRPPIQTGMIQRGPPVKLRPHPFTHSPLPPFHYQCKNLGLWSQICTTH